MEEKYLSDVEAFIRKSLSEENEAVSVYEQRGMLAQSYAEDVRETNPELAEKLSDIAYTINDIKSEEEVHIGELNELLALLGVSEENELDGEKEAKEIIRSESFVEISKRLSKLI